MCAESQADRKLAAYMEITDMPIVNDQIFNQYMYKSLPTPNHVFTFKKQFSAQAALSTLFTHLLNCSACMPHKLVFAKSSGAIYVQDMSVIYATNPEVKQKLLDMPYRFTRNMHTFVTPFGVEGWFLIAQVLASQAMLRPKQTIKYALHMFYRYEWSLQCPFNDVVKSLSVESQAHAFSGQKCDLARFSGTT
jgi:transformation/transcription domain-associated protein